jgi:hypothetical protein
MGYSSYECLQCYINTHCNNSAENEIFLCPNCFDDNYGGWMHFFEKTGKIRECESCGEKAKLICVTICEECKKNDFTNHSIEEEDKNDDDDDDDDDEDDDDGDGSSGEDGVDFAFFPDDEEEEEKEKKEEKYDNVEKKKIIENNYKNILKCLVYFADMGSSSSSVEDQDRMEKSIKKINMNMNNIFELLDLNLETKYKGKCYKHLFNIKNIEAKK